MKLIIDRRKWARVQRGSRGPGKRLFDGARYCCLGFYCQQLHGCTDAEMLGKERPDDLGITDLGDHSDELVMINDRQLEGPVHRFATEANQEQAVRDELAKVGITVEFIN
jgi:hypothetical protein